MMYSLRRLPWSALLLLVACTAFAFSPQRTQGTARQNSAHTHVRLVADARSVQPGGHFTAGVLLRMDKGWHTYWKNPGEAGLPTELHWTLPEGFTAGGVQWPLPEKHAESGDVLTYGYSDETMLLVPISVSPSVTPGMRATLALEASWLECAMTCVPGKASASITIPVSNGSPEPDNAALFEKYRGLIPAPLTESSGVHVSPSFDNEDARLAVTLPATASSSAAVDFYPEELPGVTVGRTTASVNGTNATLTIPLTATEAVDSARILRGILVYPDASGKHAAATVAIPLPPGFPGKAAGAQTGSATTGLLDRQFTIAAGEQRPLLLYLVFAFIGGLLLNIMPCVLPVVALKIFGLLKMAGDKPARVKKLGWSFSLGILVSFLVLALLVIALKAAGQQVGWGFQFQEPLFVIAMSVVVFAFGLSLFGVYEIRLPAKAVEGVGAVLQKQEGGKGYGASFSEGVFATILATPCTAPFLGTALGFAFSQPFWAILLIFATVAAGMSLPYILLTARPAWMKFLPRPGEWMVTAKQFMGFLMMATLVWLLYILGQQLGVEGVVWTTAFLLTVGVACWMIGRFLTLSATRARVLAVWTASAVVVVGGYLLFIAPVLQAHETVAGSSSPAGTVERGGISWQAFNKDELESYLRENKAVFIDFTAEWCLTCKVNEKTVIAQQDVVQKFKDSGIIPVRADWTNRNPYITQLLAKFGRSGVPLYVVFPAGKPDEPIILPEVITSSIVIDAINKATHNSNVASENQNGDIKQ